MKKILIGSLACNLQDATILNRVAHDKDYYLRGTDSKSVSHGEDAHGIPEDIFDYIWNKSSVWNVEDIRIAPLNILYTIKISHGQFDVHHNKTLNDISKYQSAGVRQLDEKLYKDLYEFWLTVHKNNKHKVRLKQEKETFFTKAVERKYVHDSIHDAVKFFDKPLYTYIHKDGSDVEVDVNKFHKLSYDYKIKLALEEISVIALERILIPKNMKFSPKVAQLESYKKLVTTMTKGFFPKFMLENFLEIKSCFGDDYVVRFNTNLDKLVEIENGIEPSY